MVFLQLEVERLTVLGTRAVSDSAALLHLELIFVREYFNIFWTSHYHTAFTLITLVALLRLTFTKVSGARSSFWVRDLPGVSGEDKGHALMATLRMHYYHW